MNRSKISLKYLLYFKTLMIAVSVILIFALSSGKMFTAQHKDQMVRIAKIEVDPAQLKNYSAALKEQMNTAINVEPGVLTYYAVADKINPAHITILEIYADSAAYKAHIETAHFKKYKETVKNMVKSLTLEQVDIIGVAKKPGL